MSAISDAEFIRLLRKDVDYFTQAMERFENLIPSVCATVQDQWRLQAQARKDFARDLEILLDKAEGCIDPLPASKRKNGQESVSC